jgi:hypothetical protein
MFKIYFTDTEFRQVDNLGSGKINVIFYSFDRSYLENKSLGDCISRFLLSLEIIVPGGFVL